MIGPIALIQIPNRAVFAPKAAAIYLSMHPQTLKKLTDLGHLQAKWDPHLNRRTYLWEELERYRKELPDYNPTHGENPRATHERSNNGSL